MLKCRWKLLTPMLVLCMQDLEVQCTWPSGWDWEVAGSVESWVDEIMNPIPAPRSSRTGWGLHQVGTSGFFPLWSLLTKVPWGCPTLKAGRGCLLSSSCLESQGCHLIPLSYLLSCFFFSCLVILLFLSCHFSANGLLSWLFSRKLSNIFP